MERLFILLPLLFACFESIARPEYAVSIRSNRCTTCHFQPGGGGARNTTGKVFGPSSAPIKSFSEQDLFDMDWRAILYTPVKHAKENRSGLAIMAAIPSVSIPYSGKDGKEWRFVHSHNIGGFSPLGLESMRDSYLRVKLYDGYKLSPQFILVGRFTAPFGLLTDEHRTYVRRQTKTTWNDREMGVLISGDWSYAFHYDLAIVNGEQGAGAGFDRGQVLKWGSILNLRYLSSSLGWMLGMSASYHNNEKNSSALSVYQVLSLDALTKNYLPGVFIAEAVAGNKTNEKLASFFSDQDYREQIADSTSLGWLLRWNYNFLPSWKFILKHDHLIPDISYRGDYYQRYGLGLRYLFNNQTTVEARYEKAIATPLYETQSETLSQAAQDIVWFLLQLRL